MLRLLVLLSVVLAAASAVPDTPSIRGTQKALEAPVDRDLEEADARIINGTTVTDGFPWFVLFPSGACGGTLVAPDVVLTSATCIRVQDPTTVKVGATTNTNGQEVLTKCSNIHPDYYRTGQSIYNDVAVIKLLEPVTGITPVRLNTDNTYPKESGLDVTTLGFGVTQIPPTVLSSTLQSATLDLVTTFDCRANYPAMSISRDQHLCAFSPQKGVCAGDSGGPLLDGNTGDALQIGVTSFTFDGCASDSFPDVFANVATYSGWINAQIKSDICDDPARTFAPTSAPPTTAPPTPTPTAHPTKAPTKEDCFLDGIAAMVTGLIDLSGVLTSAQTEQPLADSSSGGGGEESLSIWNLVDQVVVAFLGETGSSSGANTGNNN